MNKPYSKIIKLHRTLNFLFILNFIISGTCGVFIAILLKNDEDWVRIFALISTFISIFSLLTIKVSNKYNILIVNENSNHKDFYVLNTKCKSIKELLSKFNRIEKLNNNSYLYCFDSNRNLNTIVIYELSDYSKKNIGLQRRYANKFLKIKYPLARFKSKEKGNKPFHDLKIQMYIVDNINKETLDQLRINQYNNGEYGFICCCYEVLSGNIIINSIKSGDFKKYDRFINELIRIFKINNILEENFLI